MIAIVDRSDLARAMTCERAIVMLHAEWSMQSTKNFELVEQWERDWREAGRVPEFDGFVVITDNTYPGFIVEWLRNQQRLKGYLATGWGEIIWLDRGRVLDVQWCGKTAER